MILNFIKYSFVGIFIRSLKDAIKVALYRKKRKNFKINHIIELFIIRGIFGLTFFRNLIKTNFSEDKKEKNLFEKEVGKNEILKLLEAKGCTEIFHVKENIKNKILSDLLLHTKENVIKYKNNQEKLVSNSLFNNVDDINKFVIDNKIHIIKGGVDLNQCTLLQEIFLNDFFKNLARDYLNTKKFTFGAQFFVSNSNDKLDINFEKLTVKSAQKYHFDVDFKKSFKFFIYLSDVLSVDYGAHIYIPKTHKFKMLKNMISARFEDHDIENSYDQKIVLLGKSGSCFITDNYGIHKGTPVNKGVRLVGAFEYGRGHFPWLDNSIYIE